MAVLIKGKSIKCTQTSRDHYLRGKENERITVREVKGFATKDAEEALRMVELSTRGTRCKKPVYSAKINPETDRLWNKDEIRRAVDLLEENLGLTDHPRVIVEHKKHGRVHYHVLWSRFHPDGGTAKNMGNDYAAHQKTQKQLGQELKLRPLMAKGRDFKQSEVEWAKRYGFDVFKLREQITANFNGIKSGQAFKKALEAKGMVLCRGDKSQFVLILPWGQHKALSSMIHGRPTKAVLRRAFADIEITKLPTVSEGKAMVRAKLPKVKRMSRGSPHTKGESSHLASWPAAARPITSRPTKTPKAQATVAALTATGEAPAPQPKIYVHSNGGEKQNFIASRPENGGDDEPTGRAEAAFKEEFDKWVGLIDAAAKDPSLSKEQRLGAVFALRQRQQASANAARQRVSYEEKSSAKVTRRTRRALLGLPVPPEQQKL